MDAASKLRDQYLPRRAHEIALERASTVVAEQIARTEKTLAALRQVESAVRADFGVAHGASAALRDLAQGIEIDVSDAALGDTLSRLADQQTRQVFDTLGFKPTRPGQPTTAPPTHGTRTERPRAAVSIPQGPTVNGDPKHEPPPESPPAEAPPPESTAAGGGKRLVRSPEPPKDAPKPAAGRISTVTPRARKALAAARAGAKDERGATHRADAMRDDTGRVIPVDEQIVVDDVPPEPDAAGGDPEGDSGVGTQPVDSDE